MKAEDSVLLLGKYQEVALMTDLTIGHSILVLSLVFANIDSTVSLKEWQEFKESFFCKG